jgi:hypothetical protein
VEKTREEGIWMNEENENTRINEKINVQRYKTQL